MEWRTSVFPLKPLIHRPRCYPRRRPIHPACSLLRTSCFALQPISLRAHAQRIVAFASPHSTSSRIEFSRVPFRFSTPSPTPSRASFLISNLPAVCLKPSHSPRILFQAQLLTTSCLTTVLLQGIWPKVSPSLFLRPCPSLYPLL